MPAFGPLVQPDWLLERLGEPGLVVVDCHFVLGSPGAGERAWLEGHVPGASYLDVDRDLAGPPGEHGRHPLPAAATFESAARRAGIGAGTRVVAYDEAGEGGAARLWWLLRHFEHEEVAVLDGGLRGWRERGGPLEGGPVEAEPGDFEAREREGDTVSAEEVERAVRRPGERGEAGRDPRERGEGERREDDRGWRERGEGERREDDRGWRERGGREPPTLPRLLDARAAERFRGETEPIDPVAGHIPGARNVPFAELAAGGRFPDSDELRARLGDEPFVAYCGSGVTACTLVLAAELTGVPARLYPGSWSEWSRRGLPVETGE